MLVRKALRVVQIPINCDRKISLDFGGIGGIIGLESVAQPQINAKGQEPSIARTNLRSAAA